MTDQTFTSLMHLLDVLSKILPVLCALGVMFYVYWQTRSFLFIFHQIFKWLGLEGKYSNSSDQRLADDYLDLNKLNLKTGYRLRTVKAKSQLHKWMRTHNIEYSELRRAGGYFKANELILELPSKAHIWITRGLLLLTAAAFFVVSMVLLNSNYALLKVNATGTWFWAGNNEAFSTRFDYPDFFRGEAWKLQQGDCRYLVDAAPVENIWDKDVMCRLVLGFNDTYLSEAIDSQLKCSVVFILMGVVFLIMLALFTSWQKEATKLHRQLLLVDPELKAT